MQYDLVFDATEVGYRHGYFPSAGLLFVAVGTTLLLGRWFYLRRRPWARRGVWPEVLRWFAPAGIAIGLAWAGLMFTVTYRDYWRLKHSLKAGEYEVVEGRVTNFVPAPPNGHRNETFDVDGRHYEYADGVVMAGYNTEAANGGAIREGVYVRIADVGGQIARLEVGR